MERVVEGRGFGLKLAAAHRVPTRVGESAWVVPGEGFICIMASQPIVAGCDTTARTIKRGMSVVAITRETPGQGTKAYTLFGIAPDGVKRATIRPNGEAPIDVPVVNNVYAYRASTMLHAALRP